MLVIVSFDGLDENQHAALKATLSGSKLVSDWMRVFGHSYIFRIAGTELSPLNALLKETLHKDGKTPSQLILPLYANYIGWASPKLWDFIKKHHEGIAATPAPGNASAKEKNTHIVDPETLILKESVAMEDLLLDAETEKSLRAYFIKFSFQQAARKQGKTLPNSYQNVLLSGKPGVGKSTLAKAIACKLRDEMETDQKLKVYFVKAAQLIGAFRGHTQVNMQTLLDAAEGEIVIIDEIDTYMKLDSDDAMILNVLNTHLGDRPNKPVVIGTLYDRNLQSFRDFNPGFARRFKHAISIEGQTDERLVEILLDQIKDAGLEIEHAALSHMKELITYTRKAQGMNFGHIGEMENILGGVLEYMAIRHAQDPASFTFKILPQDVPEINARSGKLQSREVAVSPEASVLNVFQLELSKD